MTRLAIAAAAAVILSACASRPTDPPAIVMDYPVGYDVLADCVIANGEWPGNGFRFIPLPTLGETRITAQGGFDVGWIWTFKRVTATTSRLEVRGIYGSNNMFDYLKPTIDACVAQLSAAKP